MNLDINEIRADFPILQQKVYGKPFIYLDNGATTQKPRCVIDLMHNYYLHSNSNIHRGVHFFSEKATEAYENARKHTQKFINARHTHEIIFTTGTTESINLVASSFGEKFIQKDDELILSELEHHSNIVPWQMLCERKQAKIKVIPFNENGELELDTFEKLLNEKTKLIAVTQVSNSLGTVNPIKKIIEKAHNFDIPVLIDGAQGVQHHKVDMQELDCDFYAFSGHKIYGPTGTGVLYGKEKWLDKMPPYKGGGEMIDKVSFEKTTYGELPHKFEAGTPNYIGIITLAQAIKYLEKIGIENIEPYEKQLLDYATQKLKEIDGLTIYGNAKHKSGSISFLLKKIHHYDTGTVLDKMGIAVRTGTHCTQPIMDKFGITGTVRASFAFYNTFEEIETLQKSLFRVKRLFE